MRVVAIERAVIKGTAVTPLDRAAVAPAGVEGDRRFVVVDAAGKGLYAHRSPRLSGIRAALADGVLSVRLPAGDIAEAPLAAGAEREAVGWDDIARRGRVVAGPVAAALSRHLRRAVELVDLDSWTRRGVDVEPVTLVSRASVDHLAARLGVPALDPRRFRANLLLDGSRPHEEDELIGSTVALGGAILRVTGPIPRCQVVTRDPDTGARDADALRAVRAYRGSPLMGDGRRGIPFGVYARVEQAGDVAVGDEVRAGG